MKRLTTVILATLLSALPISGAMARVGDGQPDIASCTAFEYYPLVVNGLAGFNSLLVVTNIDDAIGFFDICIVPFGTSQFNCQFSVQFDPREVRFFDGFDLGIQNGGSAQVYIFGSSGTSSIGASYQFIFSGDSFTAVPPLQFF